MHYATCIHTVEKYPALAGDVQWKVHRFCLDYISVFDNRLFPMKMPLGYMGDFRSHGNSILAFRIHLAGGVHSSLREIGH